MNSTFFLPTGNACCGTFSAALRLQLRDTPLHGFRVGDLSSSSSLLSWAGRPPGVG